MASSLDCPRKSLKTLETEARFQRTKRVEGGAVGKSLGAQVGEELAGPKKAGQVSQRGEPCEEGGGEGAVGVPLLACVEFLIPKLGAVTECSWSVGASGQIARGSLRNNCQAPQHGFLPPQQERCTPHWGEGTVSAEQTACLPPVCSSRNGAREFAGMRTR